MVRKDFTRLRPLFVALPPSAVDEFSSEGYFVNCAIDGASLYPTYRKPFDMIFPACEK